MPYATTMRSLFHNDNMNPETINIKNQNKNGYAKNTIKNNNNTNSKTSNGNLYKEVKNTSKTNFSNTQHKNDFTTTTPAKIASSTAPIENKDECQKFYKYLKNFGINIQDDTLQQNQLLLQKYIIDGPSYDTKSSSIWRKYNTKTSIHLNRTVGIKIVVRNIPPEITEKQFLSTQQQVYVLYNKDENIDKWFCNWNYREKYTTSSIKEIDDTICTMYLPKCDLQVDTQQPNNPQKIVQLLCDDKRRATIKICPYHRYIWEESTTINELQNYHREHFINDCNCIQSTITNTNEYDSSGNNNKIKYPRIRYIHFQKGKSNIITGTSQPSTAWQYINTQEDAQQFINLFNQSTITPPQQLPNSKPRFINDTLTLNSNDDITKYILFNDVILFLDPQYISKQDTTPLSLDITNKKSTNINIKNTRGTAAADLRKEMYLSTRSSQIAEIDPQRFILPIQEISIDRYVECSIYLLHTLIHKQDDKNKSFQMYPSNMKDIEKSLLNHSGFSRFYQQYKSSYAADTKQNTDTGNGNDNNISNTEQINKKTETLLEMLQHLPASAIMVTPPTSLKPITNTDKVSSSIDVSNSTNETSSTQISNANLKTKEEDVKQNISNIPSTWQKTASNAFLQSAQRVKVDYANQLTASDTANIYNPLLDTLQQNEITNKSTSTNTTDGINDKNRRSTGTNTTNIRNRKKRTIANTTNITTSTIDSNTIKNSRKNNTISTKLINKQGDVTQQPSSLYVANELNKKNTNEKDKWINTKKNRLVSSRINTKDDINTVNKKASSTLTAVQPSHQPSYPTNPQQLSITAAPFVPASQRRNQDISMR